MAEVGFKLLGYNLPNGGNLRVPIENLKYKTTTGKDSVKSITITQESLLNAITVHYSDIKIISVGAIPAIELTEDMKKGN